jgi:hypothetical protein
MTPTRSTRFAGTLRNRGPRADCRSRKHHRSRSPPGSAFSTSLIVETREGRRRSSAPGEPKLGSFGETPPSLRRRDWVRFVRSEAGLFRGPPTGASPPAVLPRAPKCRHSCLPGPGSIGKTTEPLQIALAPFCKRTMRRARRYRLTWLRFVRRDRATGALGARRPARRLPRLRTGWRTPRPERSV